MDSALTPQVTRVGKRAIREILKAATSPFSSPRWSQNEKGRKQKPHSNPEKLRGFERAEIEGASPQTPAFRSPTEWEIIYWVPTGFWALCGKKEPPCQCFPRWKTWFKNKEGKWRTDPIPSPESCRKRGTSRKRRPPRWEAETSRGWARAEGRRHIWWKNLRAQQQEAWKGRVLKDS